MTDTKIHSYVVETFIGRGPS